MPVQNYELSQLRDSCFKLTALHFFGISIIRFLYVVSKVENWRCAIKNARQSKDYLGTAGNICLRIFHVAQLCKSLSSYMTNPDKQPGLQEYRSTVIENAEAHFLTALFNSGSDNTFSLHSYTNWLLGGTGATAALLTVQIRTIAPILTPFGFRTVMALLFCSALAGFLSKYFALICSMRLILQESLEKRMDRHFEEFEKHQDTIQRIASSKGEDLEVEIDFERVMKQFVEPLPSWIRLIVWLKLKRTDKSRLAAPKQAFLDFLAQSRWAFIQTIFFLVAIGVATWYGTSYSI